MTTIDNRTSFGSDSGGYSRFRPRYPERLFDYLASLCGRHDVALDCATGTGQAAVSLAERFDSVIAFDSSEDQLRAAEAHPHIRYVAMEAERLAVLPRSVDLVTSAQAVHWFDLHRFYPAVRAVCSPGAVVAVWAYSFFRLEEDIEEIVRSALLRPVDPYWAAGNRLVQGGYRALEFPFDEVAAPPFAIIAEWTLEELLGFAASWSAVKRCRVETGLDVIPGVRAALAPVWPEKGTRSVILDLIVRIGRV